MIDFSSRKGRSRLFNAMQNSWRNTSAFRMKRRDLIREYCGSGWGEQTTRHKTMVNLMALTVQAYVTSMVAQNPRVLISTFLQPLRPFSKQLQSTLNQKLKEIRYKQTMSRVVLDAFFGPGITKIYMAPAGEREVPNPEFPIEPGPFASPEEWDAYATQQKLMSATIWVDPGEPMIERVSLDDFGFDTSASTWDKSRFFWDEYSVPLSSLEEDDRISKKARQDLQVTSRWSDSLFEGGEERTSYLSNSDGGIDDSVEPMVRVADVWLPFENRWAKVTSGNRVLFVDEYDGPESGPYRMLQFGDVPDNIIGKAPGADLENLHRLYNSLFRKLTRQASGQKRAHLYMGDGKDARAIRNASDGEWVRVNNPENFKSVELDGPNQVNLAFTQILEGIHSRAAGNLDAKSGFGPQAKTATQESMIFQQLGSMEESMRGKVIEHVEGNCRDLLQFLWVDEQNEMYSQYTLPGINQPIPVHWTPDQREGDLLDYHLEVEPYSMQYQSPMVRAQGLTESIGLIVQAASANQALMTQGLQINVPLLSQMLSELRNQPRLAELIQAAAPDPMAMGMGMEGGAGGGQNPGNQPRRYIRENVSTQGSPDAQRTVMAQSLLAGSQSGEGE